MQVFDTINSIGSPSQQPQTSQLQTRLSLPPVAAADATVADSCSAAGDTSVNDGNNREQLRYLLQRKDKDSTNANLIQMTTSHVETTTRVWVPGVQYLKYVF